VSVDPSPLSIHLFSIKLLVEQEDKQVDIDGGPVEELHHSHTLILQLQEVLGERREGRVRDE
jgi:hypothetical protein